MHNNFLSAGNFAANLSVLIEQVHGRAVPPINGKAIRHFCHIWPGTLLLVGWLLVFRFFIQIPLNLTMNLSNFKDGVVHFTN